MDTKAKTDLFYLLTNYVNEVFAEFQLGDDWPESVHLPLYLQGGYYYRAAKLQGQTCLLMLGQDSEQTAKAAALKKHLNVVGQRFHSPVIYIVEYTTSFNRKRLIDQRIPFIVPGKQLYLPFAATDLRDYFAATNRRPTEETRQLSAVAQLVVLLQLYQRWDENTPAQHVANRLAVSKMTVSRAYAELTASGLANTVAIGRQKQLRFMTHGLELWEQAQPYLRDPVKKRRWIDRRGYEDYQYRFGIDAGETALSELGMIMTPKHRTVAINAKDWPSLKKLPNIIEQPHDYGDSVAVELWRYDPTLLSETGTVDPLSLYLSLDENQDDRLSIEKDELLKMWNK